MKISADGVQAAINSIELGLSGLREWLACLGGILNVTGRSDDRVITVIAGLPPLPA